MAKKKAEIEGEKNSIFKGEKPILFKAILIIIILILLNVCIFLYKAGVFTGNVTGFSIGENLSKVYFDMSLAQKIFLIAQWCFLILLVLIVLVKDKGLKSRKKELEGIDLKKISEKGTDLDALYKILENKKQLRISTIAKTFNVKKDVALEWAKILESNNLITIEYPGFGEPIIKISGL